MEFIQENNNNMPLESGGFSFRDVIEMILRKWYWIVATVVVCLAVAALYVSRQQPQYKRTAVILVKSDKNSKSSGFDLMSVQGAFSGAGVDNELYMLRTSMIVRQVVERLHLDIDYSVDGTLRDYPLYKYKPFNVNFINDFSGTVRLTFNTVDSSSYKIIAINGKSVSITAQYGETVDAGGEKIVVNPEPEYLHLFTGKEIDVTRYSVDAATSMYKGGISTALASENTTLVAITCQDTSADRASDILNTLVDVYNQSILQDKNNITTNTARFLDDRLVVISRELGEVENELTEFKQRNSLVDLSSSASQYLTESFKVRSEALSLETEIAVAQSIKEYLADDTRAGQLIPNVSGVGDSGVQSQIESYNELVLQRNRLLSNSGENNVVIRNMDVNLAAMRETISGAIDNYISSLNVRLKSAKGVEKNLLDNIHSVPDQEKIALGIMRQQNIKETLYTYLLQKREENALQMAVSETNIRKVEEPLGPYVPVAPVKSTYYILAVIIGLVAPLGVIILIMLFNTSVRNRHDIEEGTTIPIIGEIPFSEGRDTDKVIVTEQSSNRMAESFRMLRANMTFIAKDAQVLMFISTIPGEGKTFVSRNIAATLAFSGKRVILVDTDLRKRTQSLLVNDGSKLGLSHYLAGQTDDIRDYIVHHTYGNVDLLPAGAMPPNPSELLMSDRFDRAIAELRRMYDYIILDNVPAQAVADASVVNRVADMTIYVVREGVLDKRALPDIEKLHREKKFRNMCIVLNGCKLSSKGFGYGYGYSYGYYSDNKKKKSIRAMIRSIFTRH